MRTISGDKQTQKGRRRKAEQFASAATIVSEYAGNENDLNDAVVTLCVHAGIAASDVICIRNLGQYASGPNHQEALQLLKKANPVASPQLDTLLSLKTRAGYSHEPTSAKDRKRAERAMNALLEASR